MLSKLCKLNRFVPLATFVCGSLLIILILDHFELPLVPAQDHLPMTNGRVCACCRYVCADTCWSRTSRGGPPWTRWPPTPGSTRPTCTPSPAPSCPHCPACPPTISTCRARGLSTDIQLQSSQPDGPRPVADHPCVVHCTIRAIRLQCDA